VPTQVIDVADIDGFGESESGNGWPGTNAFVISLSLPQVHRHSI